MSRAPPSERELGHEQIETSILVHIGVGFRAEVHAVPVLSMVCVCSGGGLHASSCRTCVVHCVPNLACHDRGSFQKGLGFKV
jgi:hypothetical protein